MVKFGTPSFKRLIASALKRYTKQTRRQLKIRKKGTRAYRSFVGMNMASKHKINFSSYNERLEYDSHGLALQVVIIV